MIHEYIAGMRAYLAGKSFAEFPYPKGRERYHAWARGWLDARRLDGWM